MKYIGPVDYLTISDSLENLNALITQDSANGYDFL